MFIKLSEFRISWRSDFGAVGIRTFEMWRFAVQWNAKIGMLEIRTMPKSGLLDRLDKVWILEVRFVRRSV